MKKILLFILVFFLWTCSKDSKSPSEPEQPPIVVNLTSLNGQAQKGPFNNGTAINVAELSNTLSPTGRNFSSSITDNTGRFTVANVQLESPYVELRANGYYFNEVKNEISSGQLTLYALSDLRGKTSLNVNIITHLEKNRIAILMSEPNSKTFAQAKLQAQEEILAIFDFSRANMPASELLDISQGGAANAKLLAISAIVQGNLTVGQMSELLANISTDLASDGVLNDANLKNTLINNSKNLDLNAIRTNLANRYQSLGISATIPDFESEVNQFLKPPVVQDMSVSTEEDTPINITLAGSDPEGESLTYAIIERNNATLSLNGNVVTYTPNNNYNGTDTFTYKANDGTSDSNTGTVTITVGAVDDDPNTQDIDVTTDEDVTIAFTLTAEEYDGQSYSFALRSQPTNGSVSLSGNTATYTPNENWNGQDSFTFEATDDRLIVGVRNVATATITVNSVNDAPIANDITNQVTNENRMMQLEITLDATDVDGDDLTYRVVSTNNGSVTINNNIATYVPTQDWNGEDTFTYVANDGSVDSNTATVTITVNSVNDAPIARDDSASGSEDRAVIDIVLECCFNTELHDIDGDLLTVSIVTQPDNGTVTVDNDWGVDNASWPDDILVSYIPNPNWHGTDTFTYKANDGELDSNIATISVEVISQPDSPISTTQDTTVITNKNTPIDISIVATDADGDNLTIEVGTLNNGAVSFPSDLVIRYTPDDGFTGSDSFTYRVKDDSEFGLTTPFYSITVNINEAPNVTSFTLTTDEDIPANIVLQASDDFTTDLQYQFTQALKDWSGSFAGAGTTNSILSQDGDVLQVFRGGGTAVFDDSLVVFTPGKNQHTASWSEVYPDTLKYRAYDGMAYSEEAEIIINVNPINDAPVIDEAWLNQSQGEDFNMGVNGFSMDIYYALTDVDYQSDISIIFKEINTTGGNLNFWINPPDNNSYSFTPSVGDTVKFVDWDNTLNPNFGKLSFMADENFNGDAGTFTATAWDGELESDPATWTITVTPTNDLPEADDQSVTTDEDTAVDITVSATDIDGDDLSYSISTAPSNGTASISGNVITYTPSRNFNGSDTIKFKASDGTLDQNPNSVAIGTITITVTAKLDSFALDHSGIRVSILGDNKDSIVYSYALTNGPNGVAEVDFFGNTINNFSMNDGYPYALVNSPDGGVYAIVSSFYDDDQTRGTNSFKIIKLDSSFNEEWSFGPYQYNNGRSFAYGATLNGNILTVLSPSPDEGYTKVITFDTLNQVVERVNDYQLLNYHTEIFTLENSYVIFGSSNNFIFINEIDFDGNLLNSSSIDGLHSAYNNVVSKASNGFVIAANDKIIKIDDNFNIDWEYDYSSFETNSVLRSVIEDLDGNIAAVGYTQISGSYYIYLLKLDSSGNMIYQKTYGDSNYSQTGRSIHLDESTFNNYLIRTRWGTESGTENIIINTDKSGNRIN